VLIYESESGMVKPDKYTPQVGRTSWLIKRTERAAYATIAEALRDLGLTPSQYAVLQALVRLKVASSAELARACFVTPQAMTGLVGGLERQGYISRKPLASSRVIEAAATPLGIKVYEDATARVSAFDMQLTSRLTPEEIGLLQNALERCIDSLEEGIPDAPAEAPDEDAEVLGATET
jgi:DNA-binding MarR family transcriptional regulator